MSNRSILFYLVLFFSTISQAATVPKLSIIIFIDQLGYQTYQSLKQHLNGGLKKIAEHGISFEQAYWPSAMPATATNHAGLATGTVPKNHGIVDNKWFDKKGNIIHCDDDDKQARVFSPDGLYDYGKSSKNLMVDTIADQMMMQSSSQKVCKVFSLSHKSRSSIMCAGKLGKAIWFDEKGVQFTSSKAYFNKLPEWLNTFNKQNQIPKTVFWQMVNQLKSPQYANASMSYEHAKQPALYGTMVPAEHYVKTPHAQNLLFELAKACLDKELPDTNSFLLFLSIGTPDKIGHDFGPNSIEYLDILYHLDKKLALLMDFVHKKINSEQVLWIVTSDHGTSPILETLQEKGYSTAKNINKIELLKNLNKKIEKHYEVKSCIQHLDMPDIYLNHKMFDSLSTKTKKQILKYIQHKLMKIKGIKNIWTQQELASRYFEQQQFESYYQNQLFPKRSGDLIMQVFPYILFRKNTKGTSHKSPYHYDTHVPLIIYQKETHEKNRINTQVWMQQVTNTLAQLLKIATPSAATYHALHGLKY